MEQIDFARSQYGLEETSAVWRVLQRNWLASGEENEAFERDFALFVGTKYAVCVNSGSSANLLALASLDLPKGSRVLTSACGFPATLAPILHLGLEPVLIDYDMKTHNPDIFQAIDLIGDCDAVILAHTLGSPFNVKELVKRAESYGVPVIEDCCEAIGAAISGEMCGSFGTLGTFSFYPAHQITALGSGGMITTNDESLAQKMRSMRDWGKRYDWQTKLGDTKTSYDEFYYPGYTYDTVGYNMKLAEANAAFGREQLNKLRTFRSHRIWNHYYLRDSLKDTDLILPEPLANATLNPFGFCMTLRDGDRNGFGRYLEENGIRHRPFFAGNITKQPAYRHLMKEYPVADKLMKDSLFVGCWWPFDQEHVNWNPHIVRTVKAWLKSQ